MPNKQKDTSPNLPSGVKLLRTLKGHRFHVLGVAFDPQGLMLASGGVDNTVRLWDPQNGKLLRTLTGHTEHAWSVAFDPQGRTLASGGWDHTVRLWDPQSGKLLRIFEGHTFYVTSVTFDPQGHVLASGSSDRTVRLWDPHSGQLLRTLQGHSDSITSVAFDSQGRKLASGSDDQTVRLWDPQSGELLCTLRGHTGSVWSVPFDPQGRILASSSSDNTVRLWDPQTGELLRTLEQHTGGVEALAFSYDGALMASKAQDDTVRLWRCDTWQLVAVIPEPTNRGWWLPALTFHPTEPLLAIGGSAPNTREDLRGCLIHLWSLDLALLLSKPVVPTVTYTSAKVVLVGESNVGKSYLAHRIATGQAPESGTIQTTHGMRFWPVKPEQLSLAAKTPVGQRRDVVLWDMGGQDEYRLIHQLFLHDTTVVLILVDATRGKKAMEEVEEWNKQLAKHLRGHEAVKFLVATKLDQPSDTLDRSAIERLLRECHFRVFLETSAITGRGVRELCEAVALAIDWERLAKTSRPELFQRIRDELETRRKRGEVVLHVTDLHRALSDELATDEERQSVQAVTEQLAVQGVIARTRVSTNEPVLVLQVSEIERYAGSLIIAARNNPRGVPALELQAIAEPSFWLPGIPERERLPRSQEKPVLECTVQLLMEHGVCFQHEGLLIFPSLFAFTAETQASELRQAVSLYYDFAGAIDNAYASLVAWLVLAKQFGKVRLSVDRAEFEPAGGGLYGLRKVSRPGGFAHIDVYFEETTPANRRAEFITFVEEHLRRHGVEICEHVALKCQCGHEFHEETLRQRIARGERDVLCPVCEQRHSLTEAAMESRRRNPQLEHSTWALKTEIEKRRETETERVVSMIAQSEHQATVNAPLRILHLSDLHFTRETSVLSRLQPLVEDIRHGEGLGFDCLDYLVVSGDFTDRGSVDGFEKAYEFVSALTREFALTAQRCIFVPGNHDLRDVREAYEWRESADGLQEGEFVKQGQIILVRNPEGYPLRLKAFSDVFYHKFVQRAYPTEVKAQWFAIPFPETGLQFLALNSCWQIDQFHRKRAGLHPEAVANALREAQEQETRMHELGELKGPVLRISVWHHAAAGPEQMRDTEFLGLLQNGGVRIALHGDVHEIRRDLIRYWLNNRLHVVGAGSFGAPADARPESTARLYNLLEIRRDLASARIHTRSQPRANGPWNGCYEWPDPSGGRGRVAFYDIEWGR